MEAHHRHNAGPKFHKFSLCLRAPGEPEPVGVAIASIPSPPPDGWRDIGDQPLLHRPTLCGRVQQPLRPHDPDCREMGYTRFLTYTLPEESGSSLRAVGFQVDGVVHSPSGAGTPLAPAQYQTVSLRR